MRMHMCVHKYTQEFQKLNFATEPYPVCMFAHVYIIVDTYTLKWKVEFAMEAYHVCVH